MDINPSAGTLTSLYPGAAVVDARSRIVLPGFVNAHFHGESVLLRSITGRAPYARWDALPGLRGARERLVSPSSAGDVAALYRVGAYLHARSGTTTVADYPPPFSPSVLEGAAEAVARSGPHALFALQTWEQIESFRASPPAAAHWALSLGPEESYTVYSLESFVRASAETGFPLVSHIAEVRADAESLRSRFKKSPLRILKDTGALVRSTHLIHCNHIAEKDIDVPLEGAGPVTLCVRSALSKQNGYPFLRSLASRDVPLCLGTDWGDTDLLGETGVLRNLRRYVQGVPSYEPLELVRMATINGAQALGVASRTGSLEVGKYADIVMIPSDGITFPPVGAQPTPEEIAEIVTDYCHAGMISDVMVKGEFRVRNGDDVRTDREEIRRELRRLRQAYIPSAGPDGEAEQHAGVPLVQVPAGEKPVLLGDGEPVDDPPRERKANMHAPGPGADETIQKPPVVTRRIGKVFGEDDI